MRSFSIRLLLALFVTGFPWAGMTVQAGHEDAPTQWDTCNDVSGEEIACDNDAVFVADMTLPEGSCAKRRQTLEKTWLLRNDGTCAWRTGYTLGWVGASRMGAPEAIPVTGVLPGAVVTVSVPITAFVYAQPTIVESLWQMHSATGEPFGERFKIRYSVREDCQQPRSRTTSQTSSSRSPHPRQNLGPKLQWAARSSSARQNP